MKRLLALLSVFCFLTLAGQALAADKMAGDKMHGDKMAADKMHSEKMASDKMAAGKMAMDKKINIFNGAQYDFYTLYISPTNANAWQENLLEEGTLPNGDKAMVAVSRTEHAEAWDIKVTDKAGNSMTWVGVPLNKAGDITLMPDGKYMAK